MKRYVIILLSTVILMNLWISRSASAEPVAGSLSDGPVTPGKTDSVLSQTSFEDATWAQAFSVGMMCWNSYTDDIRLWEPWFAWESTGWYAALLHRVDGIDLLTQAEIRDFQYSIGVVDEIGDANAWLSPDEPKVLRSADGCLNYDFSAHKQRMDELLGVELELSVAAGTDLTETVTVTQHFGSTDTAKNIYVLSFEPTDEAGAFPYRVTSLSIPDSIPEVDPALTFDWDLLTEQNRLEKILEMYPGVRIIDRMNDTGAETWFFLHGGDPVMVTDAYGAVYGQFRGCYFELGESTDGIRRPQVGTITDAAETKRNLNDYILDYFTGPAVLKLDRIEGDLIWADSLYRGGYRQKLAFDRGTLVLREVVSLSDSGEVVGIIGFDYSATPAKYTFLDSWDRSLRNIEVLWENYSEGEQLRRETVKLPADWEYYPYESRWGDYTIYTNDRYIGEYSYPGDGVDYMLLLTTVKG